MAKVPVSNQVGEYAGAIPGGYRGQSEAPLADRSAAWRAAGQVGQQIAGAGQTLTRDIIADQEVENEYQATTAINEFSRRANDRFIEYSQAAGPGGGGRLRGLRCLGARRPRGGAGRCRQRGASSPAGRAADGHRARADRRRPAVQRCPEPRGAARGDRGGHAERHQRRRGGPQRPAGVRLGAEHRAG